MAFCVKEVEHGIVQERQWRNYDIHEEEITETSDDILTPFDAGQTYICCPTVLVGDKDAGKTSFLSTWVNESITDFTLCHSLIPVFSATFSNARFCEEKSSTDIQFLDTDIARTTCWLTQSDANFVFNEAHIPFRVDQDLFKLVWLEIGRDHLDRLQAHQVGTTKQWEDDICMNTNKLVASEALHCLVYWVNAQLVFDGSYWEGLRQNIQTLRNAGLKAVKALFIVSRIPANDEGADANQPDASLDDLVDPVIASVLPPDEVTRFYSHLIKQRTCRIFKEIEDGVTKIARQAGFVSVAVEPVSLYSDSIEELNVAFWYRLTIATIKASGVLQNDDFTSVGENCVSHYRP